jgi:hypothetical protein
LVRSHCIKSPISFILRSKHKYSKNDAAVRAGVTILTNLIIYLSDDAFEKYRRYFMLLDPTKIDDRYLANAHSLDDVDRLCNDSLVYRTHRF